MSGRGRAWHGGGGGGSRQRCERSGGLLCRVAGAFLGTPAASLCVFEVLARLLELAAGLCLGRVRVCLIALGLGLVGHRAGVGSSAEPRGQDPGGGRTAAERSRRRPVPRRLDLLLRALDAPPRVPCLLDSAACLVLGVLELVGEASRDGGGGVHRDHGGLSDRPVSQTRAGEGNAR